MLPRIASAALLIAALLAVLLLGSLWVYAALAVVLAAGLLEFWSLTRHLQAPAPLWILFPLAYAFLLRARLPAWLGLEVLLAAATALGLSAMVFLREWRNSLIRWALAVGGSLYLGFLLSYYAALYELHQPDPNHLGFGLVIFVLGAVWIGDTAALLVGTRYGRHRFFPRISPRKSVEGAVAGLVASTLLFTIFGPIVNLWFPHNVLLGLLIGSFAQVGDLIESQIKRSAGVKDASHLIPGHGGILDRIDSILLVGALVYYYLRVMQLA
ncbi:MAG TPA: phosphatidate cytidylyltransferase [Candidatus Limnocylindrales bacterium]|nr:phosphatidate cytidylyltransferase [Candidatus Limnocylindrales bacterium]